MSALPKPANNTDAIDGCWTHIAVAGQSALERAEEAREAYEAPKRDFVKGDLPAMAAVEGWRLFPITVRRLR